ncbi:DNA polymerase III [Anaerotruncus sp. 1XD22-93]|nr:DNA polymerase III [Lachnospiraceae bacterium]NBI76047.1 DNA polymerase III [Lachnospiraceae bacterium]RKJ84803.1 DNA polymerase III [Anaerotruncus sp. 1XD22-93]
MKIQKTELATKLNKIKGVVPKKTAMPVLQGILVTDGYLIANNIEMTVKAKIEGTERQSFIIPERAFDLINNLPDGEIEIFVTANNTITIKADKIKNKYQTMAPEQFPVLEAQEEGCELTIKADTLLKSMKRVSFAVSAQGNNAVMSAMCLQASGGKLNFVGLDGHVLAWDKVDYDGEFELLIPKNTVDKLKSLGISGEVQIKHNKMGAVFVTEEFEVYTRLVAGAYFKYQTMFRESSLHTSIFRADLLDAMIRAKMCTEEKCPVKFELEGKFLNLSIKDKTTDYHETIELQEDMAQALVIGFDARLVLETLKAFDCDYVGISFSGPKMPMIVEAEDSDFKTIVLPVAIK